MIDVKGPFLVDPDGDWARILAPQDEDGYITLQASPDQTLRLRIDQHGHMHEYGFEEPTGQRIGLGWMVGIGVYCCSIRCTQPALQARRRPPLVARVIPLTDPDISLVVLPGMTFGVGVGAEVDRRREGQRVGDLAMARGTRAKRGSRHTQSFTVYVLGSRDTGVQCHRCHATGILAQSD